MHSALSRDICFSYYALSFPTSTDDPETVGEERRRSSQPHGDLFPFITISSPVLPTFGGLWGVGHRPGGPLLGARQADVVAGGNMALAWIPPGAILALWRLEANCG